MRIVPNAFAEFEFKESDKIAIRNQTGISTLRKRVITSDDEEISTPVKSAESWLTTRNPLTITSLDKSTNSMKALEERRSSKRDDSSTKRAARRSDTVHESDNEDENFGDTPEHVKKMKKIQLIRRQQSVSGRSVRASRRHEKRNKVIIEIDDDSTKVSESSAEESGNEYRTESSRSKKSSRIKAIAEFMDGDGVDSDGDSESDLSDDKEGAKFLEYCLDLSAKLRETLTQWQRRSISPSSARSKDCIDLVSMDGGSSGDIISENDFLDICPNLKLKAYQLVGVNWLKLLNSNGIHGVLADDMGLGKTIQTIAFIGWLSRQAPEARKPHLIVVPASTLANWENEFSRFCPSLNVVTYHGSQSDRAYLRDELRRDIASGDVDVILSTYTIFERESNKDDRKFMKNQKFDYLILDEAHCIKNSETSRYMKLFSIQSSNRLLLSGTPVQNDLKELLALLSFLMPDKFTKADCERLLLKFKWDHQEKGASSNDSLVQLRSILAPFVLRRLKKDVLDQLADKESVLLRVSLSERQRAVYDDLILSYSNRKINLKLKAEEEARLDAQIEMKPKKKRLTQSKLEAVAIDLTADVEDEGGTLAQKPSLTAITKPIREISPSEARHLFTALRKAANHPLLLQVHYKGTDLDRIAEVAMMHDHFGTQCDLRRVRSELDCLSDFDLHQICSEYPQYLGDLILPAEILFDSPKMNLLRTLVPTLLSDGHRILVFSQWTRLLDLLEFFFEDLAITFVRLDGSTPIKERQILIDKFNSSNPSIPSCDQISVFLLSTKAGGLGINLCSADTVILHDLDFNPENDKQAEDRCHRIGQTKTVRVYKLVSEDTVDEDIFDMGERKKKLSAAVLADCSKQGQVSASEDGDEISSIGKILQNALLRVNRHK